MFCYEKKMTGEIKSSAKFWKRTNIPQISWTSCVSPSGYSVD